MNDASRTWDAMGIDLQVLSVTTPGVQVLERDEAVDLAKGANDFLARAAADNPKKFACFATPADPRP